jgi:hypothetical protein
MTFSHTHSDATQLDTQTAQPNHQEETPCTTTLPIVRKRETQPTMPTDIAALITQICHSIDPRIQTNDRDILCFCLHHLFLSIDNLSHITYSTLNEQVLSVDASSPAPVQDLRRHHSIWTRLQAIKQVLERMKSLCQLLNDASRSMLSSLDTRTISLSPSTPGSPEEAAPASAIQPSAEQFQDALTPVLDTWRQCLTRQPQHTFHHHFAHLLATSAAISTAPTLARIDNAFSLLFKSACLLFSDTLPTLNTAGQEAAAALLLDLMQKVDQMVQQIDVIIASLHTLIKLHALATGMN